MATPTPTLTLKCNLLCLFVVSLLVHHVHSEFKLCALKSKEPSCQKLEVNNDFRCSYVQDSVDCLEKLERDEVDFGAFSAEETLLAAADDRNLLVIAEARHSSRVSENFEFQMVVVVQSNHTSGIDGLRGKKYCNSAPATALYWTDTIHLALEKSITRSISLKCNENRTFIDVETQGLSEFFSSSCRPGKWSLNSTLDSKLKQQYPNLCALCDKPSTCEYADKHGTQAALNCITQKGADVIYTTLSAVKHLIKENATVIGNLRYLCENGTTQPLSTDQPCAWIKQSWPAILAKERIASDLKKKLSEGFEQLTRGSIQWPERLKQIIAPESYEVRITYENPTVKTYAARGRTIPTISNQCGTTDIKWCTQSIEELKKCQILSKAGLTHSIIPNIVCESPVQNVTECLKSINESRADIVTAPTENGFVARKSFNLTSLMYIEGARAANYLGVVVIKANSSIKAFSQLKGKRACFPSFNGLGWLTFLRMAWGENLISKDVCPEDTKVTSFFGPSCAPGANDPIINNFQNKTVTDNLCAACSSKGLGGSCEPNTYNTAFGEIGALKCLDRGAGEVAFLDFNTINAFFAGNRSWLDRELKREKFLVVCKNDSIVQWSDNLEECAYTTVIGNEILTRRQLKGARSADIQLSLEAFQNWFDAPSRTDELIHLFGTFLNKQNVLLPSNGVEMVPTTDTSTTYVKQYEELQAPLRHCNGDSGVAVTLASFWLLCSSLAIFNLI